MKPICSSWLLLIALLHLCNANGFSQTDPTSKSPTPLLPIPERYLIAVDTSLSMARISDNVSQFVYDLILTGMQRRMKPGDVFTLWTFNEQVLTSRFVSQDWDNKLNQALANNVFRYLQETRWEKMTRFDRFISFLNQHISTLDKLTILIINDGNDKIRGTPFDDPINKIYKEHYRDLRKSKRSFVTALVASNGKIAAYSVAASGDPIAFDDLERLTSLALANNKSTNSMLSSTNASIVATIMDPQKVTRSELLPAESILPSTQSTNQSSTMSNITHSAAVINQIPTVTVVETPTDSVEQIKISPPPLIKKEATNSSKIASITPQKNALSMQESASPALQTSVAGKQATSTPPTNTPRPVVDSSLESEKHRSVDQSNVVAISTNNRETLKNTNKVVSTNTLMGSSLPVKVKPITTAVIEPVPHRLAYIISGAVLLLASIGLFIWWYRRQQIPSHASFISQSIEREINPLDKP